MKIRIRVGNVNTQHEWTEDYDKPGIGDNGNLLQAQDWAFQLVKSYNDSCRPGESHRELLHTEILSTSEAHSWYKRTDGMSSQFRGRIVDIFECSKCGVTGKRFGLSSTIKLDSKFRAKKFLTCDPSRERLETE